MLWLRRGVTVLGAMGQELLGMQEEGRAAAEKSREAGNAAAAKESSERQAVGRRQAIR